MTSPSPMTPTKFTVGQQVIWSSQPHGGYGYILAIPAVVVSVTPKRVRICIFKEEGLRLVTVRAHNLRPAEATQ